MENRHARLSKLVSESEAKEIAGPHLPAIRSIVEEGCGRFEDLRTVAPQHCIEMASRDRSGIVNSFIVARARAHFEFAPPECGARLFDNCGFLVIAISDRMLLHFKRSNAELLTSNIQTEQQRQIDRQQAQIDLFPDFPEATWVTVAYQLDDNHKLRPDRIHLTCHYFGRRHWAFAVPDFGEGVITLPNLPAPTPAVPPAPVVVSPKIQKALMK